MFLISLHTSSETVLILRRTERVIIIKVYWSPLKYPLFFYDLKKIEFSIYILEKSSNFNLNENLSGGSKAVPCGETDRTKLIMAFRNFVTGPQNGPVLKSASPILNLFFHRL